MVVYIEQLNIGYGEKWWLWSGSSFDFGILTVLSHKKFVKVIYFIKPKKYFVKIKNYNL